MIHNCIVCHSPKHRNSAPLQGSQMIFTYGANRLQLPMKQNLSVVGQYVSFAPEEVRLWNLFSRFGIGNM